jgi:hypothetical protein
MIWTGRKYVHCANPKLKEGFTKALDKEFHSLCETHGVLKRLSPGDEDYQTAIELAINGRCLASRRYKTG